MMKFLMIITTFLILFVCVTSANIISSSRNKLDLMNQMNEEVRRLTKEDGVHDLKNDIIPTRDRLRLQNFLNEHAWGHNLDSSITIELPEFGIDDELIIQLHKQNLKNVIKDEGKVVCDMSDCRELHHSQLVNTYTLIFKDRGLLDWGSNSSEFSLECNISMISE